MPVRVLIAEDHCGLRAALRALITSEADLLVTGEAACLRDLLLQAAKSPPDVVLLDIGLPGLQGFDSVRTLAEALPSTQFLLLTDSEDAWLVRDCLAAGASGCLASSSAESNLAAALRLTAEGQLYIKAETLRGLLTDLLAQPPTFPVPAARLSPEEVEVLRLVAKGCTRRQMAEQLGISERAVDSRRERIMAKLGLRSRADVVRYAAALDLSDAQL